MSNVTTGTFPEGGNHDYYVSFTNGDKNIFSLMCKENGNKISCDLYKNGNNKVADNFGWSEMPTLYKPIYALGQVAWFVNPLTSLPTLLSSCDGGAQYNTVPHGYGSTDVSVDTFLPDVVEPRDTISGDTKPGDTLTPEDVEDAFDAMGDVFEDTFEDIAEVADAILPDTDAIGDALEDVADVFGDTLEEVSPDVEDAIGEVSPDVEDAIEEVSPDTTEEVVNYQDTVPSLPLTGINFSINPAGDQCFPTDPTLTSACVALLAEGELDVSDFFNSANSPMEVIIDKLDGAEEPKKFDIIDTPVMTQYTQVEADIIQENKIIWGIYKYTEYPDLPELNENEKVGSVRAEVVMAYDPIEGFVESYVLYVQGEAKLNGNWYDCEWKYPATDDAPEDCSAY